MAGTWTYVRGGETLKMHHVEHEDTAELIVQSLGQTSRREFTSLDALLLYVTRLQENLVATGWALSHFHPERRSGQDRRRTIRSGPDRRDRVTVLVFPTKRISAE